MKNYKVTITKTVAAWYDESQSEGMPQLAGVYVIDAETRNNWGGCFALSLEHVLQEREYPNVAAGLKAAIQALAKAELTDAPVRSPKSRTPAWGSPAWHAVLDAIEADLIAEEIATSTGAK